MISDDNRSRMRNQTTAPSDALEEQCGLGFIARIYRTTLLVWVVAAIILADRFGPASFIGLSMGTAIAAGSLRLVELTVRVLLRPEVQVEARRFVLILFLKLPILTTIMVGVVWTVMTGYANVFAFVGGVALVHAVIVLKAVGGWMVVSMPVEPRLAGAEVWVSRLWEAARTRTWEGPAKPSITAAPYVARRISCWAEQPPVAEPAAD
jgi:hypothetical protein